MQYSRSGFPWVVASCFHIRAASLYPAAPAGYNQKQQHLSTTSHHHPLSYLFSSSGLGSLPLSIITLLPPEGKRKEKKTSPRTLSSSLPAATMSGLYSQGFSPARTLSPQIRSNPDADRYYRLLIRLLSADSWSQDCSSSCFFSPSPTYYPLRLIGGAILAWLISSQYLAELLAEHQKLGPFMQVLPICSRLLNQGEIFLIPSLLLLLADCWVTFFFLDECRTIG